MRVFCSRCGAPQESAAPPGGEVTCSSCGNRFTTAATVPRPAQGAQKSSGAPIALILVLVGLGLFCVIGALAAIAVPSFMKFSARSRQSECRTNLKKLYSAQRAHFQEHDRYATSFAELDPYLGGIERRNRYAYFLDRAGTQEDRSTADARRLETDTSIGVDTHAWSNARPIRADDLPPFFANEPVGIHGDIAIMVCAGNIDGDSTLDVWSVSTSDRYTAEEIRLGDPYHDIDDTKD